VTVTDVAGNSTRTTTGVDRAAKQVTTTTDMADSNVDAAVSISVNGAAAIPDHDDTTSCDNLRVVSVPNQC
jgi:hypothetical protein